MRTNPVLARLRADQPVYGLWLTAGSPILTEDAALAGLDFVALDTQHGYWSEESLTAAVQIVSHTPTLPVARPRANQPDLIGRLLDMGALGLIVPLVNSAADARRAVAAVRYPPAGSRSAGGSRLLHYGADYFPAANGEILLAVMLETAQAVAHADEILAVPGIDCGYIGPTDLALDLGVYGGSPAPLEEAIAAVVAAGRRHGVPLGIACGSVEAAHRRAEQGFRFLDVGSDIGFFWQGLRQATGSLQRSDRQ